MKFLRLIFFVILPLLCVDCFVLASGIQDQTQLSPGLHHLSLSSAGHRWNYSIYIPTFYKPAVSLPAVLILHGAGGSGDGYLKQAGWQEKAEREGFVAIAPDGLPARPDVSPNFLLNPRLWNSGQLEKKNPRSAVDDVQFFKDLLIAVERSVNIDMHRIYLTGHSNGAGMTFRLATEMPEWFAAIAPVASLCWIDDPKPSRPLPTLYMIGMEDPLVPFEGGESRLPWGKRTTPPVETTLRKWQRALGCLESPEKVRDDSVAKVLDYAGCRSGVAFRVWLIKGQGHNWPGGEKMLPGLIVGPSKDVVRATDVIWDFLKKFRSVNASLK